MFRISEQKSLSIDYAGFREERVETLEKGKIYIQTYNPYHPSFELIKEENSAKNIQHFLKEGNFVSTFCEIGFNRTQAPKRKKLQRASQF